MSEFKGPVVDEKEEEKEEKKKKFHAPLEFEEAEIKRLEPEDTEEVSRIMRKCLFSVTEKEVEDVLGLGMSYGAFVGRMLVAVGLAWGVRFDEESGGIIEGEENAVFLEDDAVLLPYEGKGLRELLVDRREKRGREAEFEFAVTITSPTNPDGQVSEIVVQRGTKTEKVLMKMGYRFRKTAAGVAAFKRI